MNFEFKAGVSKKHNISTRFFGNGIGEKEAYIYTGLQHCQICYRQSVENQIYWRSNFLSHLVFLLTHCRIYSNEFKTCSRHKSRQTGKFCMELK